MNCPLAVWQTTDKSLTCYCRTLYMTVWETHKPGKIRMCDAPAQALAEAKLQETEMPSQTYLHQKLEVSELEDGTESFGLLSGEKNNQEMGSGFL